MTGPLLRFAAYRDIATGVAAWMAEGRASADALAPWRAEIIVPSRGVADAIAAALLEKFPSGVAGVRLQSVETLARRIVNSAGELPRVAHDAERRLAMRTAAASVREPMAQSRGLASMLERSYRDVRDSGLSLSELTRRTTRARLRDPERTSAILAAWREYESLVGRLSAIDPADLLMRAAHVVPRAPIAPQVIAGFYDMTGAQLALVQALMEAGRIEMAWVPTSAPFAQPFVTSLAAHCAHDPAAARLHVREASTSLSVCGDRGEELRNVARNVASLLRAGVAAGEIGITSRSFEPYDLRLLNRFAAEQGFTTTLTETVPLTAHRIGRGTLTLLGLRDRGFPRGDVIELVRDGLHTRTRIDVDAVDAETRRARIAGGTSEELRRLRGRMRAVDDYVSLVAELEELTAASPVEILSAAGSMFRIDSDADLEAAGVLDDTAALFARASSAWGTAFDAPAVIDAIEQAEVSRGIARRDDAAAAVPLVWAGDVMRFRGRSFRHLFVLRMEDDVFPQRRNDDPLLPDSDRRQLGLREIGDGRDEESLLFDLLRDAATESVRFSCAGGDGFGKVLRPSRFVRRVPRAAVRPPEDAGREDAPSLRQLQLIARAGSRSPFDGYVTPVDAIRDRLQSLSPTQLESFGECPQKFLLQHVLNVHDIERPERELQIHHREKGIVDHRVLERFYRGTTRDELADAAAQLPRLPAAMTARLDTLIDEQFDELEATAPVFNRTIRDIERRATRRVLRDFIATDIADMSRSELMPAEFEYRFGSKHRHPDHEEAFVISAAGVPIRVEGTIDRIDADATRERIRIVDYKSGKATRHQNLSDKIDRGVRLQLALYAMAAAEFLGIDAESVSGTIKPIVVEDFKPAKFSFELAEKRERLAETLEIFVDAILRGAFPAFPNDNDQQFNSCKYCPVNHSCRTRHDAEESYAVQQMKDPRTLLSERRP